MGEVPDNSAQSYNMPEGYKPPVSPGHPSPSLWCKVAQKLGVGPGQKIPVVTTSIIALCVLIACAELFSQRIGASLVFAPVLGSSQPYRFLTSAFLHAGFWHLLFNMYALWLVGSVLEPAVGRLRFLGLYLVSAFAGNVFVLMTADPAGQSWITATVGASGAVFGVFGALFVLMKHFDSNSSSLFAVIVLNLVIGFIPGMNISWQSHVGGLIVGALAMALMMVRRKHISVTWRNVRDVVILVSIFAVLVGLIWWTY